MANSFALDTLRQAILSQKIRESHGPSTRRSSNAAPSVSSDDVQFGVNRAVSTVCQTLPVCPDQGTSTDLPGWSGSCQQPLYREPAFNSANLLDASAALKLSERAAR